jgi:hypothetical protein
LLDSASYGECRGSGVLRQVGGDWKIAQYNLSIPIPNALAKLLDNLSTHKPKHDRWLQQHSTVHFHFTATHVSWLNQIECWFSILERSALDGASFTSPAQTRKAIDAFVKTYNETAEPSEWTKAEVHPVSPKKYISYLRK